MIVLGETREYEALVGDRLVALVLVLLNGKHLVCGVVLSAHARPEASSAEKICLIHVVVAYLVVEVITADS